MMNNEKNIPLLKFDTESMVKAGLIPGLTLIVFGFFFFVHQFPVTTSNQVIFDFYVTATVKTVGTTVIACTYSFLWAIFGFQKRYNECIESSLKKLEEHYKIGSLLEHMQNIDGVAPYHSIMGEHTSLKNLMRVFTEALKETTNNKGIIIVAGDDTYYDFLIHALRESEKSFEAILTEPYLPSWFYSVEAGENLSLIEKEAYLDAVRIAPNIPNKTRLMILKWDKQAGEKGILNDILINMDKVKKFIKANEGIKLYIFDFLAQCPTSIANEVTAYSNPPQNDFAMFDRKLIIKRRLNELLHIIPLQNNEQSSQCTLFNSLSVSKNVWINFTTEYVDACKASGKMLSGNDFQTYASESATVVNLNVVGDSNVIPPTTEQGGAK